MRPTRAGAIVSVLSVVVVAVGRYYGFQVELYAVGAALALLVAVSGLWIRFRPLEVAVSRSVRPARVHAGSPCTVEVRLRNIGRRPTPVLRLLDPVTGTRGADLLIAPQGAARATTVAYRLPTTRRGIVAIGPMALELVDPFGLVRSRHTAAPLVDLTVLPRIDEIPPLPRTVGPDPQGGSATASMGRGGDDFAALRPYVLGDDLRRVHWPTSARTDELVVRQDDQPQQGRVCVVLDVRRSANDEDQFERAVSATASILTSHRRRGDHIRLVTTDGVDSGYGAGVRHLDGLLDFLALVDRTSRGSMQQVTELLGRGASGALVLVTGRPSASDVEVLERAGRRVSERRVVRFDIEGVGITTRGTEVIGVPAGSSFRQLWTTATSGAGRHATADTRRRVGSRS